MTFEKSMIINVIRSDDNDVGRVVGKSLKELRKACGITQRNMALRLGIGQTSISKMENRGDIQLSSLDKYVSALGGVLRIEVAAIKDTNIANGIEQIDGMYVDDNQYILPIFNQEISENELKRDIVLSIKPQYSSRILNGDKTIELRRRFPLNGMGGNKAFIYSTSPEMAIIGSAQIDNVERLELSNLWKEYGRSAAIVKDDFDSYFDGVDEGYALRLSNPNRFNRPINLPELKERFGFKAPQSFIYVKPELQKALNNEYANISS